MTTPFEFTHPHRSERTYSDGRRVVHIELFNADCADCVRALSEKAAEARPLIRDVAAAMRREGRVFVTTAESRRLLAWVKEHFPWHMTIRGGGRPYAMGRDAYRGMLKQALLALEEAAAGRAGTAGR